MPTIRSAPPPMIPPRPASDARAAFFKVVAAPASVERQAVSVPQPAPRPTAAAPTVAAAEGRHMRPGSIIDIKV